MKPASTARQLSRFAGCLLTIVASLRGTSASAHPDSAADILQELRSLRETGTVLYVAAHPDDENTRLIAWLARGRGYRTGYLAVTRGDGGQNLIGPELREALGVIRTQELLAARRIDGGEQFFTRAVDFGFSKSADETLKIWDRQGVMLDMVRVIRKFRPDVIITRFTPVPGGTHGHHTSSAILAIEAFKVAGDPKAFPNELAGLPPWQATRIVWNGYRWGSHANDPIPSGAVGVDVGGYNALLGESYAEIAAQSRSMHKSQGFGSVGSRGKATEEFRPLAGEPMTGDIMDGVDTTWGRVPGGADVGPLINDAIDHFDPVHPDRSVPALLAIHHRLAALPDEPLVVAKRRQLDRIIQACLGLYVETTVPRAMVVPGGKITLKHAVIVRAGELPVRWVAVRYPAADASIKPNLTLELNETAARDGTATLPAETPVTQPYWLREPGTVGMFRVDDPSLIGRAENPPPFPIEHVFAIDGETLVVPDSPVHLINDPVRGELPASARGRASGEPRVWRRTRALRPGRHARRRRCRHGQPAGGRRRHGLAPRSGRLEGQSRHPAIHARGRRRARAGLLCRHRPGPSRDGRPGSQRRGRRGALSLVADANSLRSYPAPDPATGCAVPGRLPRCAGARAFDWLPAGRRRCRRGKPRAPRVQGHHAHRRGPDGGSSAGVRRGRARGAGVQHPRRLCRGTCPPCSPTPRAAAPWSCSTTPPRT